MVKTAVINVDTTHCTAQGVESQLWTKYLLAYERI